VSGSSAGDSGAEQKQPEQQQPAEATEVSPHAVAPLASVNGLVNPIRQVIRMAHTGLIGEF
jgi:hypothetical protein